ncbi:MAG TPA: hypothetical protein P5210_12270 [Draconibacterium sp.]|nr:hypothetical protein [Draconibacterium sp.]
MGKSGSIFMFLVFVVLLITACQKEEEPVDPIVGTWEYAENSEDFSRIVTLTFNADKSGLSKIVYVVFGDTDERNNNFTYSTKNGILTLIIGFEITDSPYSISENQLTTTFQGDLLVFTRK